jgi:hypothetical protein
MLAIGDLVLDRLQRLSVLFKRLFGQIELLELVLQIAMDLVQLILAIDNPLLDRPS